VPEPTLNVGKKTGTHSFLTFGIQSFKNDCHFQHIHDESGNHHARKQQG